MKTLTNFYKNRTTVLAAVIRDAVHNWKNNSGNQTFKDVPQGFDSWSTTTPPIGVNKYHLNTEIQELASMVEKETNKVVANAWGNIHKTNQWLGGHKHNNNKKITLVATYFAQAPSTEVLTFADQDLPVKTNMLVIFDSSLLHGIKPLERKSDCVSITFELVDK